MSSCVVHNISNNPQTGTFNCFIGRRISGHPPQTPKTAASTKKNGEFPLTDFWVLIFLIRGGKRWNKSQTNVFVRIYPSLRFGFEGTLTPDFHTKKVKIANTHTQKKKSQEEAFAKQRTMKLTTTTKTLLFLLTASSTAAFVPTVRQRTMSTTLNYKKAGRPEEQRINQGLPSFQQVLEDSFSEQTVHASLIIEEMASPTLNMAMDRSSHLEELLTAQLSHPEGASGFLTAFLTSEAEPALADERRIPPMMARAMERVNMQGMIPMVCMNIIKPAIAASYYDDPTMSANAKKTAERAKNILKSFNNHPLVVENCRAIYAVASEDQEMPIDRALGAVRTVPFTHVCKGGKHTKTCFSHFLLYELIS